MSRAVCHQSCMNGGVRPRAALRWRARVCGDGFFAPNDFIRTSCMIKRGRASERVCDRDSQRPQRNNANGRTRVFPTYSVRVVVSVVFGREVWLSICPGLGFSSVAIDLRLITIGFETCPNYHHCLKFTNKSETESQNLRS